MGYREYIVVGCLIYNSIYYFEFDTIDTKLEK